MLIMVFEHGHPNVTLKDWQGFKSWQKSQEVLPSHLIDEVVDRNETGLPDRFVPLARGGAIASDHFLHQAGHYHGKRRPPGWFVSPTASGFHKFMNPKFLFVGRYDDPHL
jgi:hypothetical protein